MDKNNDIETRYVSKWEAAPKNMGTLFTYINLVIGMACSLPSEIRDNLYDLMDKTLDEYNELEVTHHKECGMISQYEEENRNLKSELDIKTDECDDLISRVFKQDEEYTKLKEKNKKLRETCELLDKDNSKQCAKVDDLEADIRDLEVQVLVNTGIASVYESELKQVIELAKSYGLIIYDDRKDAISDDVKNIGMCGHYYVLGGCNKEESKDIKKLEKKWKNAENTIKELMQVLNYEHIDVSHSKSSWTIHNRALSEKTEHFNIQLNNLREMIRKLKADNANLQKQSDTRAEQRDRHVDLLDKLRWALEDKGIRVEWNEAALKWNLYDKTNTTCESCKQHYEDELKVRCEEIDGKNKLIEELTNENRVFRLKNLINKTYGLTGQIELLAKENDDLRKENKHLKDTIEKDGEFGKNIGKCVADSIREGCDKGVYKLHPLTRIDIHVEETNNMPMTFDRHAIPRISVIFNNTQTEMERDTAEHECEELNEKIDRVRRANDELNRKIKGLEKENKSLRRTVRFLDEGGSYELHSCPVAYECENFKPKG